jgi:hypothetical protein
MAKSFKAVENSRGDHRLSLSVVTSEPWLAMHIDGTPQP